MLASDSICLPVISCATLGGVKSSIAAFRSAYNETAIPEDAVSAQIGLIGTMRIMDRLDETAPLIAAAVKAAEATGQFAHLSKLHYLQGSICFPKGDFRGCLDAQTKALDYAEKVDDPELKARALSGLGDAFYAQGGCPTPMKFSRNALTSAVATTSAQ